MNKKKKYPPLLTPYFVLYIQGIYQYTVSEKYTSVYDTHCDTRTLGDATVLRGYDRHGAGACVWRTGIRGPKRPGTEWTIKAWRDYYCAGK